MAVLSRLLILTTLVMTATQPHDCGARDVDAVEIFYCNFDNTWDVNYDQWPDRWNRGHGPKLPHYVKIGLEDDDTAVAGRCLTVHLNGGDALVESQPVSVSEKFSYVVEAKLRMQNVQHSQAQLRLEFCDENLKVLQTATIKSHKTTEGWSSLRIGPVDPKGNEIHSARVSLQVVQGDRVDLQGKISLDDVWLARMPKMTVETNSPFNVYTDTSKIMVTCRLSGIEERDPEIRFELLDASSQRLDADTIQLEGRLITERIAQVSDIVNTSKRQKYGEAFEGSTEWHPPIKEHGFYRVRVTMRTARGLMNQHVISIAAVPPLEKATHGEFGWSLAGGKIPLSYDQLPDLLPRVAINWIKLPVWYDPIQEERGDELVVLTERLYAEDIEVVAVIDHPPAESELSEQFPADSSIAELFTIDPTMWMPALDPMLTRLSMRVRWWQLGKDHDVSFAGLSQLEKEIGELRNRLFRFGQDTSLGFGWQWPNGDGLGRPATWDFQQYSASPTLTGDELAAYLEMPRRPNVDRWVLVEPLSRALYDLPTRVHDLVRKMLTAKIHGADAIFASDPFNNDHGLMSEKGTPEVLLLPWRTTASLLSGTRHIGSLQLPQGSTNHLFESSDGSVIMVAWNIKPSREVIYLGDDVRVIDVWGRAKSPSREGHRQIIEVDALPQFVLGLNPFVAKWRMEVKFEHTHIPSVFGKVHTNGLHLQNPFFQGAGGSATLDAPEDWQIIPKKIEFKLAAHASDEVSFDISLPFNANSGKARLKANFRVAADQEYHFTVYRNLNVGVGDVEIEAHTRLDDDGSLVVEQRMINRSGLPVDFKCLLYAADHRRQRRQVFRLEDSDDIKIYRYPNGSKLIGTELWLRAEELGGSRVLNHRFIAEP